MTTLEIPGIAGTVAVTAALEMASAAEVVAGVKLDTGICGRAVESMTF